MNRLQQAIERDVQRGLYDGAVTIVAVAAYQLLGGPIARLYDGVIASFT